MSGIKIKDSHTIRVNIAILKAKIANDILLVLLIDNCKSIFVKRQEEEKNQKIILDYFRKKFAKRPESSNLKFVVIKKWNE